MSNSYDAIIIGTGQSGPALADRMSAEGQRVAVLERKLVGGTCVNVGCVPTKTLVASARAAHMARRAADFGVVLSGDVRVDMKRVKARKDEIVQASTKGVTGWMEGLEHATLIRGHGRLLGPGAVEVNGERLQAPRIVLNVGARAVVPPIPGLDQTPHLTNSGVMELGELPAHLLILGGSYIGLEFAQIYRRFGSQVTVLEQGPRLIGREDEEVSTTVREILEGEGVTVLTGTEVTQAEGTPGDLTLQLKGEGAPATVRGSHLLVAVGRQPNTDDLGAETVGLKLDQRGYVAVDDRLATNVEGLWALGDCNGQGAFTHTSYNDFEILADQLFGGQRRKLSDRLPCYGLFIDPPLGRVGMTEQQARGSGRTVLVGKRPMSRVGRARERSETQGFIKVMVDADSKEILGAAILGINGDEVVHGLLDVMYAKAPYTVIQEAVHIHPTVSELVPTVLGSLQPLK